MHFLSNSKTLQFENFDEKVYKLLFDWGDGVLQLVVNHRKQFHSDIMFKIFQEMRCVLNVYQVDSPFGYGSLADGEPVVDELKDEFVEVECSIG